LVSGGARGIDQAAMRGALEAGGNVIGVLADSLEKTTMNREHRNLLLDGQLVLISPYDPNAGFNVGNAMQRNKFIYALADAALVISSDVNKGGTWAGATEQLDKLRLVPVYVRSTGDESKGLNALRKKGALPWPNPQDADALAAVFDVAMPSAIDVPLQTGLSLFNKSTAGVVPVEEITPDKIQPEPVLEFPAQPDSLPSVVIPLGPSALLLDTTVKQADASNMVQSTASPADILFATVRDVLKLLLKTPMKDVDVAAALQVSTPQAKAWLLRLVDEGVLDKQKKPPGYIVKQDRLFE
jgi:DNA processing protein